MAIAFGVSGTTGITSGSVLSVTATISGSNRIVFGGFAIQNGDGTLIGTPSFNGTAMVKIIGCITHHS